MTQQPGWGAPPQWAQPPQPPQQPQYAPPQQPAWPGTNPNQQQYPPQQGQAPAYNGPAAAAPVSGDEFDDFFSGGVKGEPGFDWGSTHNAGKPLVGSQIIGTIVEMVKGQQTDFATRKPLFFDDGQPRMQVAITLATDLRNWEGVKPDQIPADPATGQAKHPSLDQGLRRIFVKSDMKRAVAEACGKAGQKPRKGGKLAVRVKGFEDVGKGNPKTLYDAAYQPAPEDAGTGDFFQAPAQPQAPQAPAQYAPQAPAQPQYAPQALHAGTFSMPAPAPNYGQLPGQGEQAPYPPQAAPAAPPQAPPAPEAPAAPQFAPPPY